MPTAKATRAAASAESTESADPFAALLDAVEFEPKAVKKRATIENVPQKYRDLVKKAHAEGQRVRIPGITDLATFTQVADLLRSAGDLEGVSVQCKARFENDEPLRDENGNVQKDDKGKTIYPEDLGEMTHLQFTAGNRRGVPKS